MPDIDPADPSGAAHAGSDDGGRTRLGVQAATRWARPGPSGRPRPAPLGSVAVAALRFAAGLGRAPTVRRQLAGPGPIRPAAVPGLVRPPRWWWPEQRDSDPAGGPPPPPSRPFGAAGDRSPVVGRNGDLRKRLDGPVAGAASSPSERQQSQLPGTLPVGPAVPVPPALWARLDGVPAASAASAAGPRGLHRAIAPVPVHGSAPGGTAAGMTGTTVRVRRMAEVTAVGPMSDGDRLSTGKSVGRRGVSGGAGPPGAAAGVGGPGRPEAATDPRRPARSGALDVGAIRTDGRQPAGAAAGIPAAPTRTAAAWAAASWTARSRGAAAPGRGPEPAAPGRLRRAWARPATPSPSAPSAPSPAAPSGALSPFSGPPQSPAPASRRPATASPAGTPTAGTPTAGTPTAGTPTIASSLSAPSAVPTSGTRSGPAPAAATSGPASPIGPGSATVPASTTVPASRTVPASTTVSGLPPATGAPLAAPIRRSEVSPEIPASTGAPESPSPDPASPPSIEPPSPPVVDSPAARGAGAPAFPSAPGSPGRRADPTGRLPAMGDRALPADAAPIRRMSADTPTERSGRTALDAGSPAGDSTVQHSGGSSGDPNRPPPTTAGGGAPGPDGPLASAGVDSGGPATGGLRPALALAVSRLSVLRRRSPGGLPRGVQALPGPQDMRGALRGGALSTGFAGPAPIPVATTRTLVAGSVRPGAVPFVSTGSGDGTAAGTAAAPSVSPIRRSPVAAPPSRTRPTPASAEPVSNGPALAAPSAPPSGTPAPPFGTAAQPAASGSSTSGVEAVAPASAGSPAAGPVATSAPTPNGPTPGGPAVPAAGTRPAPAGAGSEPAASTVAGPPDRPAGLSSQESAVGSAVSAVGPESPAAQAVRRSVMPASGDTVSAAPEMATTASTSSTGATGATGATGLVRFGVTAQTRARTVARFESRLSAGQAGLADPWCSGRWRDRSGRGGPVRRRHPRRQLPQVMPAWHAPPLLPASGASGPVRCRPPPERSGGCTPAPWTSPWPGMRTSPARSACPS